MKINDLNPSVVINQLPGISCAFTILKIGDIRFRSISNEAMFSLNIRHGVPFMFQYCALFGDLYYED